MASHWRTRITWIALAVGVVLLVGAIMMAVTQVNFEQLKQARPWQVGALVAAVIANLLVSGVLWWSVTLSFDAKPAVNFGRMFALVCASGLLNYLPLRPGLFGRAAYLKMKHNLPLRQSAWITLVVLGLSGLVLGGAAAIVQFIAADYQYEVALAAAVIATIITPVAAGRLLKRKIVAGWLWVPVRVADVLVSAVRLWVVFDVVGQPISYSDAVLAASAGLFVSMLGITPNGLGLREWAIAGVTSATTGHIGFAAAVIDRGVEAVVVTLAGLWAMQRVSLNTKEPIAPSR
jgi:uncharacterized membrane protein YbhN (UPF0104 family)